MNINEFDSLIGQDSYVLCKGKKRTSKKVVGLDVAKQHIKNGGQVGWWVTGNYLVVDIDEGPREALQVLKGLGIKTLACKTAKGLHLYFKSAQDYPQKVGMVTSFGLKCDLRCSQKGYVMLPYNLKGRCFNKITKVADLSPEMVPFFGRKESLLQLKEGDGRNSTLFAHLMAYKNRGASDDEIKKIAELINKYILADSMSRQELEKIIDNTQNYKATQRYNNEYIIYSDKGKPSQINANKLCEYFVKRNDVFVVGSDCYRYRRGVYVEASSLVRNKMRDMIQEDSLIKQSRIMECYNLLTDDIRIQISPERLNDTPNLINFKNGVWDISRGVLLSHNKKYKHTIQIPHKVGEFVPFTQTRLFDFLSKTKIPKEDVKMILKYMAYCLTTDNGLKTFMVLVGQSNTGKSVLIRFFETLVGKHNTSALSMHDLNMRFYPSQLYGKLLNSCADNKTLPLSSIENLKKITGNDLIMHEKKGKEPFFFTSFAKLLFSFNQLPLQLEEKSNAFYKRMRVLFMNNELFLNNAYVNDLCSEEGVTEIIPYLLSLLPLKAIPHSKMSDSCVEMLRQDSDSIHAFLQQECELDEDLQTAKEDMYQAYIDFCLSSGRDGHKKHGFMRAMRSKGFREVRDSDRRYCWRGIGLK